MGGHALAVRGLEEKAMEAVCCSMACSQRTKQGETRDGCKLLGSHSASASTLHGLEEKDRKGEMCRQRSTPYMSKLLKDNALTRHGLVLNSPAASQ